MCAAIRRFRCVILKPHLAMHALKGFARRRLSSRKLWLAALLMGWVVATGLAVNTVRVMAQELQGVTRARATSFGGRQDVLDNVTNCCQFDLVAWEAQELGRWFVRSASSQQPEHVSPDSIAAVTRFYELVRNLQRSQFQADRGTPLDPQLVAQWLDEQESLRTATQQTMRELVSRQLDAVGLGAWVPIAGSQPFPPVTFSLVRPPTVLVVSPRDKITLARSILLQPSLSKDETTNIENSAEALGWSSLVEPTGGYSSYPTIVADTSPLDYTLQTIAHEWAHTYLFFNPLGFNYFSEPDMRIINETVADIVGRAVSDDVMSQYFTLPAPTAPPLTPTPPSTPSPADQPFNFREEMRATRVEADRLLGFGQIDIAEAYMEERRQVFVARGYAIRRLNQAYFAFHGTYADSPGAVSPIGPQLTALFQRSRSLQDFLQTVATVSNASDFRRLLAQKGIPVALP